ncbi:MAG: SUMF1/EgtB/PvdO family nonheme iron enzyme, partial [Bryobacteraceae bacterium]
MSGKPHIRSEPGRPHPCCIPGRERAAVLELSRAASSERLRVASGSTEGMIKLDGGRFLMGTEDNEGFPADGEGPVRETTIDPIYIDAAPVTNDKFREFIRATGY